MCQSSVICEENKTAGILIQTTNREDTSWRVDNVDNTFSILLCTRGFYTSWFIHGIVDEFFASIDELA